MASCGLASLAPPRCSSASLTLAYGYSSAWKEPDLDRILETREVTSPTRGQGRQPWPQLP